MARIDRRDFLQLSGAISATAATPRWLAALPHTLDADQRLKPWQRGYLDIHHINTGRGNSALMICPDGTSVLIDAGAAHSPLPLMNPARPNDSLRAGQWIARYVQRQLRSTGADSLNYAVLTHLHPDHVGQVTAESPQSPHGSYRLTGISDVAETVPIRRMIDRGFPHYDYPAPPQDPSATNYIAFAQAQARQGVPVERLRAGAVNQIRLVHAPMEHPAFAVRGLAVNGEIWTGTGTSTRQQFPPLATLQPSEYPSENMTCIALRVDYGRFRYYTGGDLTGSTRYGEEPWRDIETPVSQVAGPVHAATVNHHGYFDAAGPDFVRALQARVWVLQAWHASHPDMAVLAHLFSPELYPGPRDIFSAGLHPAAALTNARFVSQCRSTEGHVLIRVHPDGETYEVIVIDAREESNRVMACFGPYEA